mgnify:CR=1 FL=1
METKKIGKQIGEWQIGKWAFIAGIIIVVLAGLIELTWSLILLVILGLVIGFLNISRKETIGFLVGAIGLLIAGTAGLEILPTVGGYLTPILKNLVALIAPAVIVVGIKEIYTTAKK